MGRYRFWIYDKDDKGKPLDENIVKAAEELTPVLSRYRSKEIGCESVINTLLQRAVEAASKAIHKTPIRNYAGYLVAIYRRVADKHIDRESRVICVEDGFLEHLANAANTVSLEEMIHNRLLVRTVMDKMDPQSRLIFIWKLEGYSVSEIAKELSVTPNCVSVRYGRAKAKVTNSILGDTKKDK